MITFPLQYTCLARYVLARYDWPTLTEISRCELTWRPGDPLVVLVTLTVAGCQTVTWPISRELLAYGYVDGCAGPGDVHIDRDGRYMILQLGTPEGHHVVALPARPVGHVLICSHDQVPIGREPVDVDSAIELILGGAR